MTAAKRPEPSIDTACAMVAATCVGTSVRRASRALTRFYDSALAPSGLRSTQFAVLVAVFRGTGATLTSVANAIGMDRSTLPRNLRPLVRRGWVTLLPAPDRRRRILTITKAGERQLVKTIPYWRQAQQRILKAIGRAKWESLTEDLVRLSTSVRTTEAGKTGAAVKLRG